MDDVRIRKNRWQSVPLDPEALKQTIDRTPEFKKSRLVFFVTLLAIRSSGFGVGAMVAITAAVMIPTLGFVVPTEAVLYVAGGIGVAVGGFLTAKEYQEDKGRRIEAVDDARSPLYDPGTISKADQDLDFRKFVNVLKKVPAMAPKSGVACKSPGEILKGVENIGNIRDALNFQGPDVKAGLKLFCKNLSGRAYTLAGSHTDSGLEVVLFDDARAKINTFRWRELRGYLERDGTIISNVEKMKELTEKNPAVSNDASVNYAGLKKYIEDNVSVVTQFDLLSSALISGNDLVVLTDLPSSVDMVDETCAFIATKVSK